MQDAPPPVAATNAPANGRDDGAYRPFHHLYARALLYRLSERPEQTRLTRDMHACAQTVTYDPDLIAKAYTMTAGLVNNWKKIAAQTVPWHEKSRDERLRHFHDVIAEHDATDKKDMFQRHKPTCVIVGRPKGETSGDAGVRCEEDHDEFYVWETFGIWHETYALATTVHEQLHLLIADHHYDQKNALYHSSRKAMQDVQEVLEKTRLTGPCKIYAEERQLSVDYVTDVLETECAGRMISTADAFTVIADKLNDRDKRYKWYSVSPEEALVRMGECYAALSYGQNWQDIDYVLGTSMRANKTGKPFNTFETAAQFSRHVDAVDPKRSFKNLIFDAAMQP